jgi:sugar lactone lactonase YvrE
MPPSPASALSVSFDSPGSVAVDAFGNVYFVAGNGIFRIDSGGTLTRLAGRSNITGYSGDGGPAINAQLAAPGGITLDSAGNLYIADTYNNVIRKVSTIGTITTIAGTGSVGESGDGGPATSAQLSHPQAVAVDAGGNLYIADSAVIRKVLTSGTITTAAGNGTPGYTGDGGPATGAQIGPCYGLALDNAGNLYISDYSSSVVRKVAPGGTISTVAGNGVSGYAGDGGLATSAQLRSPGGVAVDAVGNLYIADSANSRLRMVTSGGTITTVAGNGTFPGSGSGFVGAAGDGSPATSAQLGYPTGVAVDSAGNLYIGDPGSHRVRKVAAGGTMLSAAGNGFTGYSGDGGPAASAQMGLSVGVAVDSAGNLYISDSDNNVVRKVTPAGVIATVAGNGMGAPGYSGDGGPATSAQLSGPAGLALDASGNLYIADLNNSVVRKVTASGTITTVAGKSGCGYSGDNGPATSAQLCSPWGVAVDSAGNLYIADSGNNRIRKVAVGGIITTVAGNGAAGYAGDGGPAISALLFGPTGVAVDAGGRLYIADH